MAIIYIARNRQNDKVYIGFTGSSLDKRVYEHKRDSTRARHRFGRVIQKYGIDQFVFEILEEHPDRDYLLRQREPFYISKYNSTDKDIGYNICRGGKGRTGGDPWNKGIPRTSEEKAKMSAAQRGKKQSKHTIAKRVEKTRGLKRSDKTKMRISSTWTVLPPDADSITVVNLNDYCRRNNLTMSCMINVANGKRRHHKGYQCRRLLLGIHSRLKSSSG